MRNVYCDIEDFAIGLDRLLGDIPADVQRELGVAVPKAAKKITKLTKMKAKANGWDGKTGKRYVSGFSNKVTASRAGTSAEVGNRNVPGLVHLLEKGHNTMGGRRVAGKPHLGPAFEETKEEFYKDVSKAVERALEG